MDEEEEVDLFETILYLLDEYVTLNPNMILDESFEEDMEVTIYEYLDDLFFDEIDFDDLIINAFEYFYNYIYHKRSYINDNNYFELNHTEITIKLDRLNNITNNQGTDEWYATRSTMLTASNFHRIFESESSRNHLIHEKCSKFNAPINNIKMGINEYSSLHHGHKYEPISILIYEYYNNTKIGQYGCIQHSNYHFIGASPDGINVDPLNKRLYGRLLEIKNPVSREITGIPKKEYWVQMQMQMECCDLDHCDFLETSFIEYSTYEDYCEDLDNMKGVILQFRSLGDDTIVYEYKPLLIDNIEEWKKKIIRKYCMEMRFIKEIYWKLNKYSCVYIKRNKKWFQDNIETINEFWNIISTEKHDETLFDKRKSKKKQRNTEEEIIFLEI